MYLYLYLLSIHIALAITVGDHVDCARMLLNSGAQVDALTLVCLSFHCLSSHLYHFFAPPSHSGDLLLQLLLSLLIGVSIDAFHNELSLITSIFLYLCIVFIFTETLKSIIVQISDPLGNANSLRVILSWKVRSCQPLNDFQIENVWNYVQIFLSIVNVLIIFEIFMISVLIA